MRLTIPIAQLRRWTFCGRSIEKQPIICQDYIGKLIQEHKGRLVDAPGGNLLAEFGSVVDAVTCAVEIQRELAERNAELPSTRRMEFRIGINLGDIVEEERRIYGDGVNIAAGVESLAEGEGICISGNVHEQVKNRIGPNFMYSTHRTYMNRERIGGG
jgi:adenylate cyclase